MKRRLRVFVAALGLGVLLAAPFRGLEVHAYQSGSLPDEIAIYGTRYAQSLSAGDNHNCAIRSDGTLACWGMDTASWSSPPAGAFIQVGVAGQHSCGLKPDGSLVCWGDNSEGESVPPEGRFIQLSAGVGHNCAIKPDGGLACWGLNDHEQADPPEGIFKQVGAGLWHTCGLHYDGTITCWGDNTFGVVYLSFRKNGQPIER